MPIDCLWSTVDELWQCLLGVYVVDGCKWLISLISLFVYLSYCFPGSVSVPAQRDSRTQSVSVGPCARGNTVCTDPWKLLKPTGINFVINAACQSPSGADRVCEGSGCHGEGYGRDLLRRSAAVAHGDAGVRTELCGPLWCRSRWERICVASLHH